MRMTSRAAVSAQMAFVQHVATPARSPPEDACPRCKVPKLSELIVQSPRPSAPQRLPDTADCHVAIYKITDDASQVWADAKYKEGLAL